MPRSSRPRLTRLHCLTSRVTYGNGIKIRGDPDLCCLGGKLLVMDRLSRLLLFYSLAFIVNNEYRSNIQSAYLRQPPFIPVRSKSGATIKTPRIDAKSMLWFTLVQSIFRHYLQASKYFSYDKFSPFVVAVLV